MEVKTLIQGSKSWHEHRKAHLNASDAPAMMGMSLYKSRTQLLIEKKTGITPDVDTHTQRIFDKGHEYEAMMRPIIEAQEKTELYPVTGSREIEGLPLSASFDGIDLGETFCFEHKTLNGTLVVLKSIDELDKQYKIQMQQQLMVGECDRCLFVASNGVKDDSVQFWYKSDEDLAKEIIAGWHQFQKDLEVFELPEEEVKPESKSLMELPALSISIMGEVSSSNLEVYKSTALQFISEINTDLQTDEDFAQAEVVIKFCDLAEKELESVKKQALAQTADIDLLFKTVDYLKEEMRSKRLTLNKLVKSQKEVMKATIVSNSENKIRHYIAELETELNGLVINSISSSFPEVIKGKRNISSMNDAVDTELARLKIQVNESASIIRLNVVYLDSLSEYKFLFNDLQSICSKPNDDFKNLVNLRVSDHKKKEREKLDLERNRIRQEEQEKARKVTDEKKSAPLDLAEKEQEECLKHQKIIRESRAYGHASVVCNQNIEDFYNIEWLVRYVKEEGFTQKHIQALCTIVSLFNESEESEKEIFEFVDKLKSKYKKENK